MKVALRKNKGILEFLGFVDGKGRIRKPKMRKVNPHFRGRYISVPTLSANYLYSKNRKQLLSLKRKQEKYIDELDKSMDGWDKVTEPAYQNQRTSAMRVLRADRDKAEQNIRSINSFLVNA
jgi:hypothetical protein